MRVNYEVLAAKNKLLHDDLLKTPDTNTELIKCNNKMFTFKVKTNDCKQISMHSKYNIDRDIYRFAESVDYSASLILCIGFGLGYEIEQINKRLSFGTKLLVIEPRLDILKKSLDHINYSHLLASSNFFIVGGSVDSIKKQLQSIASSLILTASNIYVCKSPVATRLYNSSELKEIIKEFRHTMTYIMTRIGNDPEDNLLGINHIFSNLPYILSSPVLNQVEDYKGYPAICVASGPSLDKNIDVLLQVQDKALILCADSALDKLLNHGIVPDIVTAAERTKGLYNDIFKGRVDKWDERVCLIGQAVIYPKIFEEFPGKTIVCSKSSISFEKLLGQHIPTINNYETGVSCAHISFATAKLLQCNPIILVGQDLAYGDDGFTHAKGTYGENRTENDEKHIASLYVKSINQKSMVKTSSIWDSFRRWFESVILNDPAFTYINATEGGAHIEGTKVIPLKEVAEKYLKEKKVPFYKVISKYASNIDQKEIRQQSLTFLENEFSILKKIKEKLLLTNNIFLELQKLEQNNQLANNFALGAELLRKGTDQLGELVKMSPLFNYVIQAPVARGMQYINANRRIADAEDLKHMYLYVWKKFREIDKILDITIAEFERGIKIIETGKVDTIDTPLLGEMYRW